VADLVHRAQLDQRERTLLVEAGALASLAGHRNEARWSVAGVEQQRPLFSDSPDEDAVLLPAPSAGEDLLSDYSSLGLTLGAHPMSLLRDRLRRQRWIGSMDLASRRSGARVRVAGLITLRQRPATAHGTTFLTLEDEHGVVQVIVWPDLGVRQRKELLGSNLLAVEGKWEKAEGVGNLIATRLYDLTEMLGGLDARSRDFH
jgi:error-prone DNA polymerase